MEKFIRLDMKGTWRGKEHRSAFGDPTETITEYFEEQDPITGEIIFSDYEVPCGKWESGISCYCFKYGIANAVEQLRSYWMDIALNKRVSDYENMQVTIFEGELVGEGADGEDTATCENTLVEADALPFMEKVMKLYESMEYDGDIDEEEYKQKLQELVVEYMTNTMHDN